MREIDLEGIVADITTQAKFPASWEFAIRKGVTAEAALGDYVTLNTSSTDLAVRSSHLLPPCYGRDELISRYGMELLKALESLHRRSVLEVLAPTTPCSQAGKGTESEVGDGKHTGCGEKAQVIERLKDEINIPLPSDRGARGMLHRSLRACFPGLSTCQHPHAPSLLRASKDTPKITLAHALLQLQGVTLSHVLDLLAYMGRGPSDPGPQTQAGVRLGGGLDRDARKQAHELITKHSPALQCISRNNTHVIVIWKPASGRQEKKKRRRSEVSCASSTSGHSPGNADLAISHGFLARFVLCKRNVEHLEALQRVGRALGLPLSTSLATAGVKDKRAITYQYVTASIPGTPDALDAFRRGVSKASLLFFGNVGTPASPPPLSVSLPARSPPLQEAVDPHAGPGAGGKGVGVGNLQDWGKDPSRRPLQAGQSLGNAFRVVVRHVHPRLAGAAGGKEAEDRGRVEGSNGGSEGGEDVKPDMPETMVELDRRLQRLASEGFVNFFGAQRVGIGAARGQEQEGGGEGGGEGGERGRATLGMPWELGRALLKQDFPTFLRLFLGVREEEDEGDEDGDGGDRGTEDGREAFGSICRSRSGITEAGGTEGGGSEGGLVEGGKGRTDREEEQGLAGGFARKEKRREGSITILRTSHSQGEHRRRGGIQRAKALFWDQSTPLSAVLRLLPPTMTRERLFVRGLQRYGREEIGRALREIPHQARTQWVNAYQAWLWNRLVVRRVQRYGLRAVAGDMVLEGRERGEGGEQWEGGRVKEGGQGMVSKRQSVRFVTAEELTGDGAATALAPLVVFPVIGYGVQLPRDEAMHAECCRLLEEEGMWEMLRNKCAMTWESQRLVGKLKGAYRPLLVKPEGLEWTFLTPKQDNVRVSHVHAVADDQRSSMQGSIDMELRFRLPPGSFATVLIREVLGKEPVSW